MSLASQLTAWLGQFLSWPDGLDPSEYIEHLEKEFHVHLGDGELASVRTLGDMEALLARTLTVAGDGPGGDMIWPILRRITSTEFGIDESELHQGVRFVEDLQV